MFPESRCFVAILVTSSINDSCSNLSLSNIREGKKILFDLVTGTATKLCISGNMIPKIKTCRTGWSNLRKFEQRGIKIVLINSIIITKSVNLQLLTLILCGVGGPL